MNKIQELRAYTAPRAEGMRIRFSTFKPFVGQEAYSLLPIAHAYRRCLKAADVEYKKGKEYDDAQAAVKRSLRKTAEKAGRRFGYAAEQIISSAVRAALELPGFESKVAITRELIKHDVFLDKECYERGLLIPTSLSVNDVRIYLVLSHEWKTEGLYDKGHGLPSVIGLNMIKILVNINEMIRSLEAPLLYDLAEAHGGSVEETYAHIVDLMLRACATHEAGHVLLHQKGIRASTFAQEEMRAYLCELAYAEPAVMQQPLYRASMEWGNDWHVEALTRIYLGMATHHGVKQGERTESAYFGLSSSDMRETAKLLLKRDLGDLVGVLTEAKELPKIASHSFITDEVAKIIRALRNVRYDRTTSQFYL